MTHASSTVRCEVRGRVAVATLCRADGSNGLDRPTADGLHAWAKGLQEAAGNGSVRVAVLRHEGFAFSVGGDLQAFRDADSFAGELRHVASETHEALRVLAGLPVPLVTVVDGVAAGGGLGLVLAGDIVFASESAKFRMAYLGVGLSPDCGVSWRVVRRLGSARAVEFALSNRVIGAEEALVLGLVSRVHPADELEASVHEFVELLARAPREAVAETLRLLRTSSSRSFSEALDDEADTIVRLSETTDGVEGVDAFFGKRRPMFS